MAQKNWRAALVTLEKNKRLIQERLDFVNKEHAKRVKQLQAIQKELDFIKKEMPKAKQDVDKAIAEAVKIVTPLADKDDELAALKSKKPVDKNAVKKLEKEIAQMAKKASNASSQMEGASMYQKELVEDIAKKFTFLDNY